MIALRTSRFAPAILASLACLSSAHAQVRISQVGKTGGVNVNAYDGQYVELFNAGPTEVPLTGKSVQVASSAGSGSWTKVDLEGSIAAGSYRLIRLSTYYPRSWGIHFIADQERPVLFNGTPAGNTAIGDGAGKAVLADTTTLFTTSGCAAPDSAHVLDLVTWDDDPSTAACHEGSACALIPRLSGVGPTSATRRCGGLTDTNDNLNDFVSTARPPRNSTWTGAVNGPAVNAVTEVTGKAGMGTTTGFAGQTVLFTSTPTTCSGAVTTVKINLAPVGGSAAQSMFDDATDGDAVAGDGTWSYRHTIPSSAGAPLGTYTLDITATDSAGLTGTGLAQIIVAPTPPLNDQCVNAEVMGTSALPVSVSAYGNLVSASPITQVATGCTTNGGNLGTSRDVWFSFTPVESSYYTVTTCNSVTVPSSFTGMSTNLTIFTTCPDESATDLTGLSYACNSNGCNNFIGGSPSTISSLYMEAGTPYLIRVAKQGSGDSVIGAPFRLDVISEAFGACCLSNGTCITTTESACATAGGQFWGDFTTCSTATCPTPPAPGNNECENAVALTPGTPAPGTTYGASGADITTCGLTSWDVWYSFTPTASGPFTVDVTLTGGAQTPAIAIFASCPPVTDGNLACVGVPAAGSVNSLTFDGTSGTPYLIRIATNFSQRSEFQVVLSTGCPADFDGDGTVDFFDYDAFVTCFEGNACPPGKSADFDGDGSADFFDYDAFVVAFETAC
ncbi:MAG: hypothetical protein AABZ53_11030 [Planctomycetota bacterium]